MYNYKMQPKLNEIQRQIQGLVNKLNQWDWEYHQLGNPSVSDQVYDNEYKTLESLEQQFPQFILPNSPTQKLGEWNSNKFAKISHKKPMLSLNKAYSKEDVFKFLNDIKQKVNISDLAFNLEPKIDGLSIALKYQNGKLIQAVTRGNGVQGDDVTENIFQINLLPKKIPYSKDIEIRGEIYLSKTRFKQLNENLEKLGKKVFANPRNATAGTLKLLDKNIVKERGLSILAYDIVNANEHQFNYQSEITQKLKNWGFPVSPYMHHSSDFNEIWRYVQDFKNLKNDFEFECDGFVIKLNNLQYWDLLGHTSKFPKYALAFKYETEEKIGTIKEITTTVGRTGKITYVANFEEKLELNQTLVSNATLHNYEYILDMNINIGDKVLVIKSGEIIPKVIALVRKNSENAFAKISNCPACGSLLIEKDGQVDQFCINENCSEQRIRALIHFCSKQCANIETLGNEIVRFLYQNNFIIDFVSIFELKQHKEAITKFKSFGNTKKNNEFKKIDNILNSIEKSKNIKLANALFAIGIANIGQTVAQLIAQKITKLSDLININLDILLEINTIGPIIVESIKQFISKENNRMQLIALDGIFNYQSESKGSDKLANLVFVITGTLSQNRDWFKNEILRSGGKVSSSISKNTNYLLAGENAGSKLDNALKLGVKVINEQEFMDILKAA
ncbi:DNA ligase (NAD+) [Mycoplasmopsis mustelae]|uniref:DNA ligase n=1 Tax=Mycoplasmopsis mustelae TaxID=171289 RepID=A0A4R7UCV7_9BACT|nr:NAD-dependent DNA ligase LigA [Mycoplasmopsis mustelae]TDV24292.1 DNA ligase (NAD+) [Mycoplasmopsis mustelae]